MFWLILIGIAVLLFSALPLLFGHFVAWLYCKLTGSGQSPGP